MGAVLGTLQRTGWRRPASLPAFRGRPSPWRVAPGRLWLLSLLAGILGFAGALPGDVLAASVQLGLRPEAAQVRQSIELGVTIEGATSVDGEPRIPPVEGLRFRRAGQQTNFSLVNGKMSRSITFQFLIQADKAGEYTIGPVEIQVGKETLRSGKTKLQIVAAGTAPPASGGAQSGAPGSGASGPDPIFVEARIDKSKVYAGEQVTLRLRFCQAVGYRVLETQLDDLVPEHFDFLIEQLVRVMKPGHNVSFHCMLMPTSKERDGYIGLKDFRGDLIRAFQKHGFIFASEVVIWKDPVTAMQRTKALGLLHKTVRENACMSRQGIPDYLVTVRTPGEMVDKVKHTVENYPVSKWQRVASPIWMDIDPNDTLQYRSAREHDDERHICPLQLEVIRRGVELWTNPGDIVLSPFAGIGSEGYVSLQMGRKFIGAELKESYYRQAAQNMKNALMTTGDLFGNESA